MLVWLDPVARPGPEAMAVDEWLAETSGPPVLRVYRWAGAWGSIGYFGSLAEARTGLPGPSWVRRWTGGGTVDHRRDWTYTLVAPAGSALHGMKGAESYRVIHEALSAALAEEGMATRLASDQESTGEAMCFSNPVGHDLVDKSGRKLAGAGQRRTRVCLLHQGSVALPCDLETSGLRASALARNLSQRIEAVFLNPPGEVVARMVASRYGNATWTQRR